MIVNRHPDVPRERMVTERRDQREPRKQPLRHAPVVGVRVTHAATEQREPGGIFLDGEHHIAVGLDVVERLASPMHRIGVDLVAMYVRHMRGVDAALHRLQIIALLNALGDEHVFCGQTAPFHLRRRGLFIRRAHVRPDHATALDAWVSRDPHAGAHLRGGLGRSVLVRGHFEALAIAIEFQSVIGAADAVLFVAPKVERHAAMRAEFADQADVAIGVAKCQQFLTEDLHAHLRPVLCCDFRRRHHRHPIAAHEVAHQRAGAGSGEGFGGLFVHGVKRCVQTLECADYAGDTVCASLRNLKLHTVLGVSRDGEDGHWLFTESAFE